jgi:hypothetical protein
MVGNNLYGKPHLKQDQIGVKNLLGSFDIRVGCKDFYGNVKAREIVVSTESGLWIALLFNCYF